MAISLGWICVCTSVRETATGGVWRSRLTARETMGSREQPRERERVCVCLCVTTRDKMHKPVTG